MDEDKKLIYIQENSSGKLYYNQETECFYNEETGAEVPFSLIKNSSSEKAKKLLENYYAIMEKNMAKLYTWKETIRTVDLSIMPTSSFETTKDLYGTYLATNSEGKWVMEVKGTGEIVAVDKSSVEEVIPHTVTVKFWGNSNEYSYLADKGKWAVGDLLVVDALHGAALVIVAAVDTKSTAATKELKVIGKVVVDTSV